MKLPNLIKISLILNPDDYVARLLENWLFRLIKAG